MIEFLVKASSLLFMETQLFYKNINDIAMNENTKQNSTIFIIKKCINDDKQIDTIN